MAIVYNTKNQSLLVADPKSQPLSLQLFEMERAFSNSSDFSRCTNCSDDYSQVITLSMISIAGAIVGTLGNSLVLLAITRNVKFRSVQDFLIFSLSTADLIVSAIYMPFDVKNTICYPVLKNNATHIMIRKFVGKLMWLELQ